MHNSATAGFICRQHDTAIAAEVLGIFGPRDDVWYTTETETKAEQGGQGTKGNKVSTNGAVFEPSG